MVLPPGSTDIENWADSPSWQTWTPVSTSWIIAINEFELSFWNKKFSFEGSGWAGGFLYVPVEASIKLIILPYSSISSGNTRFFEMGSSSEYAVPSPLISNKPLNVVWVLS